MTRDDQIALVAPTSSGDTGLFTVITADTLRRGDWSFGIYLNDWDLEAGDPPNSLIIPSARKNNPMGYELYRLNASIGYGLTDRWELSASVPWDRLKNNGNDRSGFINGFFYSGRFSDSGLGDVHLSTKFGFGSAPASRLAVSLFTDLPTGKSDSGISTGNVSFGAGGHWTGGPVTAGAQYVIRGRRSAKDSNFPAVTPARIELPNEFRVEGGLNWPLHFWRTTNWISEANGIFYTGGDFKPKAPVFVTTGIRHWFGDSGWALNAGARWNVAKFSRDNAECAFTELDDCGLSGLVGLTFAPLHLAAVAPPPPPVAPPPPPPPPAPAAAPVAPPEAPPVTPPKVPTEIRTDEIHFEPGSGRLTNIAKAILDDVALRMKQEPAATAIVIGYTDDREATGPTADLDRHRAEAVRDYLVTRHGIDPARITVEGHDAREPVGDNSTAEGRLRNRRVVIRLLLP